MINNLGKRPVMGRIAKQQRSERARSAIVEGVVAVLASHGVAGLTHRRVAEASGTSLAATTYYFATKGDMIAEVSNGLLARYLEVFAQAAAQSAGEGHAAYVDFISRVAANGLDRDRKYMLSWYEIMLDGTRDAEARGLAKSWYAGFDQMWRQRAKDFGLRAPEAAGPTGVDLTVGAMIHGLGLGWTPRQYTRAVTGKLSANTLLGQTTKAASGLAEGDVIRKSRETRERLRDAAIALLGEGGGGAVTYRAVAARAGLSPAAPAYHFDSSKQLLAEAQGELFARQKARYREVVGGAFPDLTLEIMTDLTAVIFQREATEFGGLNVAGYAIWLEASREPDIRAHVRPVMSDLYLGWRRLLTTMGVTGGSAFEAMCIQFLFVGAQIRVLASGASPRELVGVMGRLKDDISALVRQRHWLQAGGV